MSARTEIFIGINAFGHDASACVVDGSSGQVLFALAEERLSNIKHDDRFPLGCLSACLDFAKERELRLTALAFGHSPHELISDRLADEIRYILGYSPFAPQIVEMALQQIAMSKLFPTSEQSVSSPCIDNWLGAFALPSQLYALIKDRIVNYQKWRIRHQMLEQRLAALFPGVPITYVRHHLAHAAAAFYNSGFERATVLVIDGQGETDAASIYTGDSEGLHRISVSSWPHSLGLFYLTVTEHLGFWLGDEYKVMGMAAYGQPRFYEDLRENFSVSADARLNFQDAGLFQLSAGQRTGLLLMQPTEELIRLMPLRRREDPLEPIHFDFAASIQKVAEEIGREFAEKAVRLTGIRHIALAGGVCLNGLINECILRAPFCDQLFIYPAAGDDGTAVGAAQQVAFEQKRFAPCRITSCFYGRCATKNEIRTAMSTAGADFTSPSSIHRQIAQALAEEKLVARFVGGSEFGPRALGHRSILANPRDPALKDRLNEAIKQREPFRPFAPVCRLEKARDYFEMAAESPFMLLICRAKDRACAEAPAIVHADHTARLQTVDCESNPDLYAILEEFERLTGHAVLLNTSFNSNREAIVETPRDALEAFAYMQIDCLALEGFWIEQCRQAQPADSLSHAQYLARRRSRYHEEMEKQRPFLDLPRRGDQRATADLYIEYGGWNHPW
jgi:carbamoyltransferase